MVKPTGRGNGVKDGRYKGVRMRKWGKWVAEVRQPKSRQRIWLGSYETSEEAARAYDAAVLCLRRPSAVINFPESLPPAGIGWVGDLSPKEIQAVASRHARRELVAPISEESYFAAEETGGESGVDDSVIGGSSLRHHVCGSN